MLFAARQQVSAANKPLLQRLIAHPHFGMEPSAATLVTVLQFQVREALSNGAVKPEDVIVYCTLTLLGPSEWTGEVTVWFECHAFVDWRLHARLQ